MPRQTERPRVAGVILAAGASRRMGAGRNKMLLQLEGEPRLRFVRGLFGELLAWRVEGFGRTGGQRYCGDALYLDGPAQALADVDTPEYFSAAQQLEPT